MQRDAGSAPPGRELLPRCCQTKWLGAKSVRYPFTSPGSPGYLQYSDRDATDLNDYAAAGKLPLERRSEVGWHTDDQGYTGIVRRNPP